MSGLAWYKLIICLSKNKEVGLYYPASLVKPHNEIDMKKTQMSK